MNQNFIDTVKYTLAHMKKVLYQLFILIVEEFFEKVKK